MCNMSYILIPRHILVHSPVFWQACVLAISFFAPITLKKEKKKTKKKNSSTQCIQHASFSVGLPLPLLIHFLSFFFNSVSECEAIAL